MVGILKSFQTKFSVFKISLLLVLILKGMTCFGQILNIEKVRLDSLDRQNPYRISFESKFNFYNRSAGVDDQAKFASFSNDLNAVLAPGKTSYVVLGNLAYTENNGSTILNNGYLHLRTNFNYQKKWSEEVYGQVQYDNFRGLNQRYLLGGGIRWHALNSKKVDLFVGTGPMYEMETWKIPNNDSVEDVRFLKLSNYFIVRWAITENMNFNTIFYYQVGYDQSINNSRNRLSSTTNFNFIISKHLAFTTSISMAYEDRPIIPITKFIYGVENGLTLSF